MKIRLGYVSNSSSSSFVVIGRRVGNILENNLKLDFENKNYAMLGKELYGDGSDFIKLTPELFKWMEDRRYNVDFHDGEIIEVIESGENSWSSDSIKIPDNICNAYAYFIHANHCSSSSIEDLERHYIKKY